MTHQLPSVYRIDTRVELPPPPPLPPNPEPNKD